MENYYKKTIIQTETTVSKQTVSKLVTLNTSKLNTNVASTSISITASTNKTNNKNDLKKILLRTPSKTPLQLSAKKKTPHAATIYNDRYIPNRFVSNMEVSYHLLHTGKDQSTNGSSADCGGNGGVENDGSNLVDPIKRKLINDTCNGIQEKTKILNLHNKPACGDTEQQPFADNIKALYNTNAINSVKKTSARIIPSTPDRILDAPDFRDDYYLSLIDWSSNNSLAVALNKDLYIWQASTGEIHNLFSMDEESNDYITSTAWIQNRGNILAVGNSRNSVELWDVNRQTCIRHMRSHVNRVGCLSWNQHILSSGSRSGVIHHHDVRVAQHHVGTLKLHEQEVCGLKWSPDGRHLASGANDNLVAVWDSNMSHESQPLYVLREHTAAVKAIAWCPWQNNILATGGGTADGQIRIWNIYNGNMMQTRDAKSQISCLLWSKYYKELISSHGYQQNQLTIWKYPEMTRVCDLLGHTNRVLMMALSPDEEQVVSVGADETLRLWKCFSLDDKQRKVKESVLIADKKTSSHTSLTRCIR